MLSIQTIVFQYGKELILSNTVPTFNEPDEETFSKHFIAKAPHAGANAPVWDA